jgi:S-adenosylmethionine hydrolase
MARSIVIITDCIDIAANELRAAVLRELHDEPIMVEPIVPIYPAFSVINANFAVRLMADAYPPGTVLLCVCSAGKTRGSSLIGRTANGLFFVGRNNGAFDWLTRDFGVAELFTINHLFEEDEKSNPSGTFGGRAVAAPTAAKVARGVPLSNIGRALEEPITRLPLQPFTVVHVDNFGLMKMTGTLEAPREGTRYTVTTNGQTVEATFGRRLMGYETGTWMLFPGSSYRPPLLELGLVRGNGAQKLNVSVGDVLQITQVS